MSPTVPKICVLGFPRSGTSLVTNWIAQAGIPNLWEVLVPWHHLNEDVMWAITQKITGSELQTKDFTSVLGSPKEALALMPEPSVFKHFFQCLDGGWVKSLDRTCFNVILLRDPLECLVSHYQASLNDSWQGGNYVAQSVNIPEDWAREILVSYAHGLPHLRDAAERGAYLIDYRNLERRPVQTMKGLGNALGIELGRTPPMRKQTSRSLSRRVLNLGAVRSWLEDYPKLSEYSEQTRNT